MISFESQGSFKKTDIWLAKLKAGSTYSILDHYAKEGVALLSAATPLDSGETATSWSYEIISTPPTHQIIFKNSHVVNGENIAILINYGHGTRNGGYVEGRDFINPVAVPLFDRIVEDIMKEVSK